MWLFFFSLLLIRVCLNYCRSYFCISNFILPFAVHFTAVNLVKARSAIAFFLYNHCDIYRVRLQNWLRDLKHIRRRLIHTDCGHTTENTQRTRLNSSGKDMRCQSSKNTDCCDCSISITHVNLLWCCQNANWLCKSRSVALLFTSNASIVNWTRAVHTQTELSESSSYSWRRQRQRDHRCKQCNISNI